MPKQTTSDSTPPTEVTLPEQDEATEPHASDKTTDEPKPKKKRRRRRKGRRGGKNEASAETGAGSTDESSLDDASSEVDADPDGPSAIPVMEDLDEDLPIPSPEEKPIEEIVVAPGKGADDIFADITFEDLGLRNSVMKGVRDAGFVKTTYIQARLIPEVLAGRDVLGQAKTGSGKTAAFGLPLFHMATRNLPFQSIVLCPTRELAIQIAGELSSLGKHTPIQVAPVYGGQAIGMQNKKLERGPEIIVATPGRLMDLHQRRMLHFDNVKFAVLDEVDRMLDIGFRDDIRRILRSIKSEHQTIFVSATISPEIESLARTFMKDDAEKIVAAAGSLTVSLVKQHYLPVEPWDKRRLLLHLLTHEDPALTVIFCRTKRTVDGLTKYLNDKNVDAHAIHGDMYQGKRNAVMRRLREGKLGVLVASDLAARGLDVENISHVVNYDLPEDPEVYIHRIGRTARAGRGGVAWSLVTPEQGPLLTAIEKLANVEIPLLEYPDFQPGPVPDDIRKEKHQQEKRREQTTQAMNRYAAPPPPPKQQVDTNRFPGGLVPTKPPPRSLGGRVKTSRSMRQVVLPPPTEDEA